MPDTVCRAHAARKGDPGGLKPGVGDWRNQVEQWRQAGGRADSGRGCHPFSHPLPLGDQARQRVAQAEASGETNLRADWLSQGAMESWSALSQPTIER